MSPAYRTLPPDHEARVARMMRSLDGLSVGDALGQRFFVRPPLDERLVRERAVPASPWKYTDDTEMALAVVSHLAARGSVDRYSLADKFMRRYRDDPERGYGGGAHRLLQSLCEGALWPEASRSLFGGEGSFGNGGAMRVAPLGAYFAEDPVEVLVSEARASAEVTHAHEEGQSGAVCTALAAAWAWRTRDEPSQGRDPYAMLEYVIEHAPRGATRDGLRTAVGLDRECSVVHAASVLGNGSMVSSMDTVPLSLWCAARWLDSYEECMWRTLEALGDRDTTCAIAGGIVALRSEIPAEWLVAREPLRLE